MAIKKYRPTSAGRRQMSVVSFASLTTKEPEKSLIEPVEKNTARSQGKITVRHHGGRQKRFYRQVDFKRDKYDIPARVASIEYDPNRSTFVALLHYVDGEKRYILAPAGIQVGDRVVSGEGAEIKIGNSLPLSKMPLGSIVHNIELTPKKGGQIVRGAGTSAVLMNLERDYAQIKMPSGEIRLVPGICFATLGSLSNEDHKNVVFGKAGRKRHFGIRPHVRGVAMAPNAHPHGGGEGRSGTGMPPKTPWGKRAMGLKTRKKKASDKLILKRRK